MRRGISENREQIQKENKHGKRKQTQKKQTHSTYIFDDMRHQCPYCFTETGSQRGLHSHMMQKKTCRESMEADAYFSESASDIVNEQNDSNSPTNYPSDIEMDFEGPLHSRSPTSSVRAASPVASPQPPASSSPNQRATVEDAEEDDEDTDTDNKKEARWIEEFPYPAGVPIGEGVSRFEEWRRDQVNKNEPPWSPFESREEWELAEWLITSGVSQKKIDAHLKLKSVRFFTKTS